MVRCICLDVQRYRVTEVQRCRCRGADEVQKCMWSGASAEVGASAKIPRCRGSCRAAAELQSCRAAELQWCKCNGAKVQMCKCAKMQRSKGAKVPM